MCAIERSRAVGGRRHAERVGDVQPVRPGLHQPGGGHRRRAHRRPEPRQLAAVGHPQQFVVQRAAGWRASRPAAAAGGVRGSSSAPASTKPVGLSAASASTSREAGLVGDGEQRDPVGPQQVRDLVGDRPSRRRGVGRPAVRAAAATSASRSSLSARRSATIGRLLRPWRHPNPGAGVAPAERRRARPSPPGRAPTPATTSAGA